MISKFVTAKRDDFRQSVYKATQICQAFVDRFACFLAGKWQCSEWLQKNALKNDPMAELPDRNKREARLAGTLARLGSRQRRELEALLGNPPDITRVPESYWAKSEDELAAALLIILASIYSASARLHGLPSVDARSNATEWATTHAAKLVRDFTDHSQDILQRGSADWSGEPMSGRAIREVTLRLLGPDRMARMAVNETTVAQHSAAEEATEELWGLDPNDTWRTSGLNNVCPVCRPFNGTRRSVWERRFPSGPPEPHVGCNCFIDYVRGPHSPPQMGFNASDHR